MPQSGFTPLQIYSSSTASNVPSASNLVNSTQGAELAINIADGKLFYKDSGGTVQVLATKGGVGSSTTTQVLYNSSGLVVGSANMTFSGTTLTTANDASISGLTVGKGGGAIASNTALGYNSLSSGSQSGTQNFAAGWQVLTGNTTGSNNVGSGAQTLFSNTTGSSNTGTGTNALPNNTTGSFNSAFGQQALNANTTASNNTAVGYQAGYSTQSGTGYNTFLGNSAGYSNTTGALNVYIGQAAGYYGAGTGNTSIGANATNGASYSGTYNTVIGYGGGNALTSGSKNTILGSYSGNQGGLDIRTASNYIVLSDGDGNPRVSIPTGTATATIPNATGTVMVSGNMPAFSATQSVSQNISTTTATKLTFTSSDFDTTGGMFASSRFTPTVAGYYQISSAVQTTTVGSTASYSNYFYIYKNGSTIKQSTNISLINLTQSGFISALVYCNGSTDYIEIYFYQGSGTTVATFADTTRTYFQGSLVRTA